MTHGTPSGDSFTPPVTEVAAPFEVGGAIDARILSFARSVDPDEPHGLAQILETVDPTSLPSWDDVMIFGDGYEFSKVNAEVGYELFAIDHGRLWAQGSLMVFRKDGQGVRAVMTSPEVRILGREGSAYGADSAVIKRFRADSTWLIIADAVSRSSDLR